jgi:hypothetical protein
MKKKPRKISRQAAPAISRRLDGTVKQLNELTKQIEPMRIRIRDLERLSSELRTGISEINGIKQRLEIAERNVAVIRIDVNSILHHEADSGTMYSRASMISERANTPIDGNAVKDLGPHLGKT